MVAGFFSIKHVILSKLVRISNEAFCGLAEKGSRAS
jgi:hypothetical protein